MAEKIASLVVDIGAKVANLEKSVNEATGILKSFGSKAAQISAGFGLGIGEQLGKSLVNAIGNAIGQVPALFSDLVREGERVGSIAEGFRELGGSSASIEEASKATLGLVNSFDLMAAANAGVLRGIPNMNANFAKIADLGARVADQLGGDTKESINGLVEAIAKGTPKLLAHYGVVLKNKDAYKDFDQIMAAVNARLAATKPIGDSVTNAWDSLKNSVWEAGQAFGIGANQNEALTQSLRTLQTAMGGIDWAQVGSEVADFLAGIVELGNAIAPLANTTLRALAEVLHDVHDACKFVVDVFRELMGLQLVQAIGSTLVDSFKALGTAISDAYEATKELLKGLKDIAAFDATKLVGDFEKIFTDVFTPENFANLPSGKGIKDMFSKVIENYQGLGHEANEAAAALEKTGEAAGNTKPPIIGVGEGAGASADEIKRLREEYDKWLSKTDEQLLGKQMDVQLKGYEQKAKSIIDQIDKGLVSKERGDALLEGLKAGLVGVGDKNAYAALADHLYQTTYESTLKGLEEAVKKGAITPEEAQARAQFEAEAARNARIEQMHQAEDEVNDYRTQKNEENAKDAAEKYKREMEKVLGEVQTGLGDVFSKLGFDFGKELGVIFDKLGTQIGGLFDAIGKQFNISGTDVGSLVGTGLTVIGNAIDAKGLDKKTKSNQGTGKAVGSGVGAVAGGVIGTVVSPGLGTAAGAAIGAALGGIVGQMAGGLFKWGPQNPETQARHAFANWLEDQFKKLGEVSITDAQGKVKTFLGENLNVIEGASDRFNKAGWGDKFKEWGANATQVFKGLGQALEETLGLTEEVGDQIGLILGETLAGNVDNARSLVQQLGLDMQDMIDALVNAGLRGEMSWLEVQSAINGVTEAFKPGLVAANAYGQAFDNIIASGGKGFDAIKSLKDIAVEAGEAGIKSLDQLQQQLLAAGKDPAEVKSLFAALQAAGLTSIQAIAEASTQTLGSVIANMEAGNSALAGKWESMRKEIEGIGEALEALPDEKEIILRAKAEIDDDARKLLDAMGAPRFTGGEQSMPINTGAIKQQSLGKVQGLKSFKANSVPVAQGGGARAVHYHIDARGAQNGVGQEVIRALQEAEDRAVTRTLEMVTASRN